MSTFASSIQMVLLRWSDRKIAAVLNRMAPSLNPSAASFHVPELGALAGKTALAVGWLMDRVSPHKTIAVTYVLTGIFIYAIGNGSSNAVLLGPLSFKHLRLRSQG